MPASIADAAAEAQNGRTISLLCIWLAIKINKPKHVVHYSGFKYLLRVVNAFDRVMGGQVCVYVAY